jgi:hypothetical protein
MRQARGAVNAPVADDITVMAATSWSVDVIDDAWHSGSHTRLAMRHIPFALALVTLLSTSACKSSNNDNPISSAVKYTEQRAICADRDALRHLYFGDLHFHSRHSWDAYGYDLRVTPDEAYGFAKGQAVYLPPLDNSGKGTRKVMIGRPLDFAGLSDHGEYLGEVAICDTPGEAGYDSEGCKTYREGGTDAVTAWGMKLVAIAGKRLTDICGSDGARCRVAAKRVWEDIRAAADKAYDKTETCGFTSFVGYEYTSSHQVTNLHRNVFFRNGKVPELPITYYEAPTPWSLWTQLDSACSAVEGCEVMVIPHNSNWSNGRLYAPVVNRGEKDDAGKSVPEAEVLALRSKLERVLEVFQHKGDMECQNGLGGASEAACDFEKLRPSPVADCAEATGWGGIKDWGCVSKYDFMRGIFSHALTLPAKQQKNPYRLGIIGSSDSHNGTPGNTWEVDWPGHVGISDDTPAKRLSDGNMTHRGRVNNPGGLAAVWAVENSRDALWEAMLRGETYATSGTRIKLRFFGSVRGYPADLCSQARKQRLELAYKRGVAMGGALQGGAEAPTFWLRAEWDPGPAGKPGQRLQVAQVVKGWVDAAGKQHQKVFDVAGDAKNGASVDPTSCTPSGPGEKTLCAVWQDPEWKAGQRAFYYARVLENPVCRWSTRECNAIPAAEQPEGCADTTLQKVIRERAWSSPIWLD